MFSFLAPWVYVNNLLKKQDLEIWMSIPRSIQIPHEILLKMRYLLKIQARTNKNIWEINGYRQRVEQDFENYDYAVMCWCNNCFSTVAYISGIIDDIVRNYNEKRMLTLRDLLPNEFHDGCTISEFSGNNWLQIKRTEIEKWFLHFPSELIIWKRSRYQKNIINLHAVIIVWEENWEIICFHQFWLWWVIGFSTLKDVLNHYNGKGFMQEYDKPVYLVRKVN